MDMFANYADAGRRVRRGGAAPDDDRPARPRPTERGARRDDDREPRATRRRPRPDWPPASRATVAHVWYAALREALDRPLTSYYLLLGASALLLTIGLIMVLSASSVYSFENNDGDSYARGQAPADVGGDRPAVRLGRRAGCRSAGSAGSPGRATSSRSVLLLLTAFFGVAAQRQHELAGPRPDR